MNDKGDRLVKIVLLFFVCKCIFNTVYLKLAEIFADFRFKKLIIDGLSFDGFVNWFNHFHNIMTMFMWVMFLISFLSTICWGFYTKQMISTIQQLFSKAVVNTITIALIFPLLTDISDNIKFLNKTIHWSRSDSKKLLFKNEGQSLIIQNHLVLLAEKENDQEFLTKMETFSDSLPLDEVIAILNEQQKTHN